ncbi:MAG: peptidoglycan DD-metalloendopeptidase family protein [Gammaproteobacteria bacterium]|nr:peptidoglycan DD-metalloendopeptidase family protein [Gammaproteobacteria bacterium]MBU2056573.1 peptidoglycan DD-metalloendopeptidase family protein [Gammaproteobacteria bacterium]MBU2173621.1 peptidoglycan DD-metalloendopeptidase family protein [Gammaproteobacteria bacterium]MBU2246597.1 peptidoglycan DD-metalloendopeptidase family protein [Gammaproteobacteria bacterium]MBU2344511.1 peptidoglycan DD-metalloendopeptidase family protein [Gammaproteobacteria bacterium]
MAEQLLFSLLLCSLWSGLLWFSTQPLLKKFSALQHWPALYWSLLILSFLPLLPMPELYQDWSIPSVLLQDTVTSVQAFAAQPQHPGLVEPAANTALYWYISLSFVCIVSLLLLWRLVKQWQQVQQLIAQAEQVDTASLLSQAQLKLLPHSFEIRQTQVAVSPFISGWKHMVLVLPAYVETMSEQQRQLLIEHELVHLQRRDPQQLLLLRILVALCWFNPVLRLIEQAFIRSMELAVDKAVLKKQPEQALLYGQTLLCSLKQSQAQQMPALMPGFIQNQASQSFYQQRLQQLFQPAPVLSFWQKWRATAVLCSTALLLNVGCAQLSFSSPPEEWLLPVGKVPITSFYGVKHPFRQNRPHQGLDFGAKPGATVKAAQKGKVLIADDKSLHDRYGKTVLIDHGHGYQTLYAHLDDFYIKAGQTVEPGQPIGKVGATGRVTGPHLHFELLVDGKQQDPTPYLKL